MTILRCIAVKKYFSDNILGRSGVIGSDGTGRTIYYIGSFKSWIFRIAHREGLRMLKRERRHGSVASSQEHEACQEIADSAPLAEDIVVHHEQFQRLETALKHLNDAGRKTNENNSYYDDRRDNHVRTFRSFNLC